MADETYRIEIPIVVQDRTGGELQTAERRINRFEQTARRTNGRLRRMFGGRFAPVFTLIDRTRATIAAITGRLRGITTRAWRATIELKDRATGKLKQLASAFLNPFALLGAGAGAAAGILFPLKLAGEMEQAQMAMEFFTKSAEKGQAFLQRLQQFAAKTPFEFPDVRDAAVGLMPLYTNMYSVDQAMEETVRTLRAFGDAAGLTGAGMKGMNLALLGFRQIGSMGRLGMEEMRQVTENLLIPMDMIGKELGLTGEQMGRLAEQGIDAKTAMEAIVRALETNFVGGMERMSVSLIGLTSTIKDTARLTVTEFGAGMATPVRRVLLDLVGLTDGTNGSIEAFQQTLRRAGEQVGETFERIYHQLKGFWSTLAADPEFQKLTFGDRLIFLLNKGLDGILTWINGEGGARFGEIFGKIGEIAARAWLSGLQGAFSRAVSEAGKGNVGGAAAMLGMMGLMGGGLVAKGAIGAGKALGKGALGTGKWIAGIPATPAVGAAATAGAAAGAATGAATGTTEAATRVARRVAAQSAQTAKAATLTGKIGGVLGRAALPISAGIGLAEIIAAKPGERIKTAVGATGRIGGAWAGAKGGALAGGALGTMILPGIGTGIGALLGGLGGGIGGAFGGEALAKWLSRPATMPRNVRSMGDDWAERTGGSIRDRHISALATGTPARATINIGFDMQGLISNIVINNRSDIDKSVDEITSKIAADLRTTFYNKLTHPARGGR